MASGPVPVPIPLPGHPFRTSVTPSAPLSLLLQAVLLHGWLSRTIWGTKQVPVPQRQWGKGLKGEILPRGSQAQPAARAKQRAGVPVADSVPDPGWTCAQEPSGLDAPTAKAAVLTLLLAPTVNYLLCILQQQLNSINSLCSVFNKHHYHITSQDYANPAKGIISLPKVTLIYQF